MVEKYLQLSSKAQNKGESLSGALCFGLPNSLLSLALKSYVCSRYRLGFCEI